MVRAAPMLLQSHQRERPDMRRGTPALGARNQDWELSYSSDISDRSFSFLGLHQEPYIADHIAGNQK